MLGKIGTTTNFDVLLTVHLSIILVINQLYTQNRFIISLFYAYTCFEHCVLIIWRSKLYYTASGIITLCRWLSGAQVGLCTVCRICMSHAFDWCYRNRSTCTVITRNFTPIMSKDSIIVNFLQSGIMMQAGNRQNRRCTYNVTLRLLRATTIAMEKQ